MTGRISGEAFLTQPGPFSAMIADAIRAETGIEPELSTTGGTSDARFLSKLCPTVEFGLLNATMHKVDEAVAVDDLQALTRIYAGVIARAGAEDDIERALPAMARMGARIAAIASAWRDAPSQSLIAARIAPRAWGRSLSGRGGLPVTSNSTRSPRAMARPSPGRATHAPTPAYGHAGRANCRA